MLQSYSISLADSNKVNALINEANKHTFHLNPESVKSTLISVFSSLATVIGFVFSLASLIYENGYEHWDEIQSVILHVTTSWLITCALAFFVYLVTQKISCPKTNRYDRFIDDIKQAQLICNDQGVIKIEKIATVNMSQLETH